MERLHHVAGIGCGNKDVGGDSGKAPLGEGVLRGQPLPKIKPLPLKTSLPNRLQVRRSNTGGTTHPPRTRHQAELSRMAGQACVISILCATVSSLVNWE